MRYEEKSESQKFSKSTVAVILFVNQKEFPNTASILDSLYMTKMRQLIDECSKVSEAMSIE